MASILRLIVFGLAFTIVDGRWLKGRSDVESWQPPQETQEAVYAGDGRTPLPTLAPEAYLAEEQLRKRDFITDTCGYLTGYSSSVAIYCPSGLWCLHNVTNSVIGCGATTAPNTVTSYCLNYANTLTPGVGTMKCPSSAPYCELFVYAATDSYYPGYGAVACGVSSGATYIVDFTAPGAAAVTTPSSIKTTTLPLTTTTPSSTLTSPTPSTAASSTVSTTSSASPSPTGGDGGSSTPIGAIVGGAVGGVAVLALIGGLIAFFVLRSKKNKKQEAPVPEGPSGFAPGPGPYTGPQAGQGAPMVQTHPQGAYPAPGYAPSDNRSSTVASTNYPGSPKSGFESSVYMTPSPPVSPPPQNLSPVNGQHPQHGAWPQQPAQQPVYQSVNGHMAELPSQRGDSELRELPAGN